VKRLGLALATPLLAGCPTDWGFYGEVRALKEPNARVDVLAFRLGQPVGAEALATVPGAAVTCDGCPQPIAVDADGRFRVPLGTSYSEPKPIVLHVRAPGYDPVDLEIPKAGAVSQVGPPTVLVVLTKHPP
jgi:hypothetical protein